MGLSVVLVGGKWTITGDEILHGQVVLPSPPDGWEYTGDFDDPTGQYALPYITAPVGWGKISQYYKTMPARRHPIFGIRRPFLAKARLRRPYVLNILLLEMWGAFLQGNRCSDTTSTATTSAVLKNYKSTIEAR